MEIMYLNEDNLILSNKNFISFMGEINDLEILSPNINHISLKPNKKVKTYIKNKEYFTNLKLTDISKKKITELSSYEEMCTKLLFTIYKKPKVIILYNADACICEKYKNKFLNFIIVIRLICSTLNIYPMCCHHQISTSWLTCPQLTTSTCTSRSPVVGRGGIGILGSFSWSPSKLVSPKVTFRRYT